ncbi:hypothetical protein JCM4814A_51960 [Streptomyces phaeofaciens JCM 4814]|uniref:Lipoprotein n=1 Tax=Streptomyces phaeofaciens TaxID=68254 RepID=A0A918HR99_9ACTN|nr:hypothetical protein [Streptomyces phaeofaciens]GGT99811.1 hypothetical protein GCM10010226_91070 [Streptomyces phaeofaciens]
MISQTARRTLPTVFLVLTAAGCSVGEEPGRGPVALDVRPLSGATAFSHADAVRLHDREERAVAACMSSRGQKYTVQPRTASARNEETNPYGLLTQRKATQDGYGIVGEYLYRLSAPAPADEPRKGAWQAALTGTPAHQVSLRLPDGVSLHYSTDGCVARARAEVYGADWNTVEPLTVGLANRVMGAVETDPGYRAAVRRWSACMTKAGHPAKDLQAPRKAIDSRLRKAASDQEALRTLGSDEILTARADADCQADTGLSETVRDVQRAVEKRLLTADDRKTVASYVADKRKALAAGAA